MNKYLTVAKVNFRRTTWIAYLVAGISALSIIVDYILDAIINIPDNSTISMYSTLYLVCLMAPIFIASVNYVKLMNIGVKKKTYFFGCIINYITFATVISLIGVLEHYIFDLPMNGKFETIYGLISVFGWDNSVFSAFFSQFAFLLMIETIIHTLTFMQTKWYGLAADVLIIAIISVFTSIPVLRKAEIFFFRFTIFEHPAIIQITVCLALAALFYSTNLFYLKKRNKG